MAVEITEETVRNWMVPLGGGLVAGIAGHEMATESPMLVGLGAGLAAVYLIKAT